MALSPKNKVDLLKNQIKFIVANKGLNLTQVVKLVAKKYNKSSSLSNFSDKFTRGSLTILELYEILDILNIDFELKEKL